VEETAMLALETFAKLKRYSVIVLMNNKFVDFVFPQLETWWQLEVMTTNYIYFL
jgi:lipopolysaccharide biosynthesis protein